MAEIAEFMNTRQLGSILQGYQDDSPEPVLATPAAVATTWYVGGAVAGAAVVAGAYVAGSRNG